MAAKRDLAEARKARQPQQEVQEVVVEEAPQAEQEPVDGILLVKRISPEGSLAIDVQTVGKCQITEVQTVIELGLKSFREQIGLDKRA